MTFDDYCRYFESIIHRSDETQAAPYDKPAYIEYTRLNWSRMNRWLKTGQLTEALKAALKRIAAPQQWIVITEPWCGDAAHSVPFLQLAAREQPLITVSYELRDSEPFRINDYLTNNGKAIPKLIVRDTAGADLAVWGPRPAACQQLYESLQQEQADFEQVKLALQGWYNADKGQSVQRELAAIL